MNQSAPDPVIGRLIDGRYQVSSRIARGGMATVYLATDLRLERQVALKVMHGHLTDDTAFRDRFIQEARSAARLAHPNVVNVFDQGNDHELAYLVMEYLPGITLRELLQEHGVLTTAQTLDVAEAILAGLAAAHRAGIVHRDLKPENVLLADDGRIKIGDFGLARAASAATATGQALLGTVAYLSPELVTRGVADARSDLYAVGIIIYEMLTGEQPFKGDQPMQIAYQHANESVPPPSAKKPGVAPELDELVLWATSREAAHRPKDAGVLLDSLREARALIEARGGGGSRDRTAVLPETPIEASTRVLRSATEPLGPQSVTVLAEAATRSARRAPWLLALVLVLAAVAGTTGWYFGSGPGSLTVVPQVRGLTVDQARLDLAAHGIVVAAATRTVHDPEIEEGLVTGTDPAAGQAIERDAPVVLLVSEGPEPLPVPLLAGLSETDAEQAVAEARFTLGEAQTFFDDAVPAGRVIRAETPEGAVLDEGDEYLDQRPIVLVLSLGPVPPVRGLTVEAATTALTSAGLRVVGSPEEAFHDKVEAGRVISITGFEGPLTTDDGVRLRVSKGPDLVEVPKVEGLKPLAAAEALKAAGLKVAYSGALYEEAPINGSAKKVGEYNDDLRIDTQSSGQGSKVKRNSTITLTLRNKHFWE